MSLRSNKLARNYVILQSKLHHWFKFDHLQPEQGIALLISFPLDDEDEINTVEWSNNDEVKILNSAVPLVNGKKMCSWLELEPSEECNQLNAVDCTQQEKYLFSLEHSRTIFAISVLEHRLLLKYWKSGKHPEITPLKYFIEWAKTKGHIPDWLPTAVELGFLKETISIKDDSQLEKSTHYSASWLKIQQDAMDEFFNPNRAYDTKKEHVVEWIKQRAKEVGLLDSHNIASSMFSIIKPVDHNPKKKRVNP